MMYLKYKYAISFLKSLIWKLYYGKNLLLSPLGVCFEQDVRLVLKGNGQIIFGHQVYICRRTDIEIHSGICSIGPRTFINKDCTIIAREKIIIGKNCLIGEQVSIYDHDHVFSSRIIPYRDQGFKTKSVTIGNNVWIGCKVFIGKGVSIGDNTVIAAGSIVVKDIPNNVIYYNGKIKSI